MSPGTLVGDTFVGRATVPVAAALAARGPHEVSEWAVLNPTRKAPAVLKLQLVFTPETGPLSGSTPAAQPQHVPHAQQQAPVYAPQQAPVYAPQQAPVYVPQQAPVYVPQQAHHEEAAASLQLQGLRDRPRVPMLLVGPLQPPARDAARCAAAELLRRLPAATAGGLDTARGMRAFSFAAGVAEDLGYMQAADSGSATRVPAAWVPAAFAPPSQRRQCFWLHSAGGTASCGREKAGSPRAGCACSRRSSRREQGLAQAQPGT